MDYVAQAFAISNEDKQTAKQFYKDAVKQLANKHYKSEHSDAHTELSAIFGVRWMCTHRGNGAFWKDAQLYAEANIAFNYANGILGANGKFEVVAKKLLAADERVSDATLKHMGEQMNCMLTCTMAEDFTEYLETH